MAKPSSSAASLRRSWLVGLSVSLLSGVVLCELLLGNWRFIRKAKDQLETEADQGHMHTRL